MGSGWECKEYVRDFLPFQGAFRPNWEKLYKRWLENDKKEWACFDKKGKLEFVESATQKITDTEDMPNEWATGDLESYEKVKKEQDRIHGVHGVEDWEIEEAWRNADEAETGEI